MEGKHADYNNNFNLFEYFTKITLHKDETILQRKAIFIDENTYITFDQLNKNIVKLNNYIYDKLDCLNENQNKIIGIHLKPDIQTVQILMAIHSMGLCYLPIDPLLPVERMEYIINDSKPLCIITNVSNENNKLESIINNLDIKLLHLEDILKEDVSNLETIKIMNAHNEDIYNSKDAACIIYTSGSTGKPKGVCLSHYSIMNRLNWQWDTFEISLESEDVGAFKTSLNFVDHIAEIFSFILKGLPVCILAPEILLNPTKLIDAISKSKITYFVLVPSLLKNIIATSISNNVTSQLKSVKRWVCSGEELSIQLLSSFFDMNLTDSILSNFYGSTEVTADLTFVSFTSREQMKQLLFQEQMVPIGMPVANSKFILLDENMNHVKHEEPGEIYAAGQCLAMGYLNESLNSKFLTHENEFLFKTGDFGFIQNNMLYFAGRKDSQLKIRGKRVDLNDLIFYANKIEGIESFVPLVVELKNNKIIIAYYKSNTKELSESEMSKMIRKKLELGIFDYMMPSYLIKVDSIPLLYNGKIDKQHLINLFKETHANESSHLNDNSEKNSTFLYNILECIKNLTGINIDGNDESVLNELTFEEVGINSLNAVEIYIELTSNYKGQTISFEKFISSKSLKDLINLLQSDFSSLVLEDKYSYHNLKLIPLSADKTNTWKIFDMFLDTYMDKSFFFKCISIDRETHFNVMKSTAEFYQHTDESFIVFDDKKKDFVCGAYLNNFCDEFVFKTDHELHHVFDLFDFLHERSIHKVDTKNLKILYNFILTTNSLATVKENLILMTFMEQKVVEIAKKLKYDAILTMNSNNLTKVRMIFILE